MTDEPTLRVGAIVHYWWADLGFDLGPNAAIITRVYLSTAAGHPPTRCVDLTIFPQYGDHNTRRSDCMVWHRDDPNRDEVRHFWCWPDESGADGKGG